MKILGINRFDIFIIGSVFLTFGLIIISLSDSKFGLNDLISALSVVIATFALYFSKVALGASVLILRDDVEGKIDLYYGSEHANNKDRQGVSRSLIKGYKIEPRKPPEVDKVYEIKRPDPLDRDIPPPRDNEENFPPFPESMLVRDVFEGAYLTGSLFFYNEGDRMSIVKIKEIEVLDSNLQPYILNEQFIIKQGEAYDFHYKIKFSSKDKYRPPPESIDTFKVKYTYTSKNSTKSKTEEIPIHVNIEFTKELNQFYQT